DAVVGAFPERDLAAGAPGLGTGAGGAENAPHAVGVDAQEADVVVVGGGGHVAEDPVGVLPVGDFPVARAAVGAGLIMAAGEVEDGGATGGVEGHVLHVNEAVVRGVVAHQRGVGGGGERGGDGDAGGGLPGCAAVVGLQVVEVGAAVHVAGGVAVEGGADAVAVAGGGLVVAADAGEFLIGAPGVAVAAAAPVEFAAGGVFGEEVEEAVTFEPVRLRVGGDGLAHVHEAFGGEGDFTAEEARLARGVASADEAPDVAFLV